MAQTTDGMTRILGDELAKRAVDIQALLHKGADNAGGLGVQETMELYTKLELLEQTRDHLYARLSTRHGL
jgi:hypothetical protein